MISTMAHSLFQSMNRFSFFLIALLVLPSANLFAQEAATGGAENSTPPSTNQPSGLLTPPSDDTAAAPAAATTTTTTTTERAKSSSAEPSPREIERVQQQAIIRRQELLFKANQAMESAQKAELADQYPVARQNYLFAAEAYGSISRATITYARAAEGLTRVDFRLYDNALQIGDTGRAKMLIDEVVHYNPNNKAALERQVAINRALANPNDTSILGNHAINPAFVKQVNEVQQLLSEAEQFRRTGQWDEAEARLKRILGIDPYNITATKQLERIDAEKNQYADAARLETRKERLDQVEQTWYEPITNRSLSTSAEEAQPSLLGSTHFSIDQQLKSITISLDFNNATIEEATNFLHGQSQQADPDHKGINFIILPKASETAKSISLTLNSVPLGEALRYISQIANVKYKVQDYAISIVPFNANTDDIISRTFSVQPSFVAPPMETGTDSAGAATATGRRPVPVAGGAASPIDASGGDTVRQALEAKGIKFPPGSSAVYSATTGQLTVQNTADQMELLEELVNAGQAPTLMVRISAKFVEINQKDVNDLTFNSAFNFNPLAPVDLIGGAVGVPLQGNGHPVGQPASFSTSLAGTGSFSANSIDELLIPQSTSTNQFGVHGFVGAAEYNMIIQALSQKKSFDLLSEPFNMTKSGETGTLEAIRVFPYPIAFDPPELITQPTASSVSNIGAVQLNPPAVIPATPTDFKRRNVGVRLVSRPQISADDKTIDLSLVPEVTDFEGFINYGSAIQVANPPTPITDPFGNIIGFLPPPHATSLLSPNLINQPVFDTRRINTKVQIRDGSTVVLGGLIREDLQKIDQKVPILGDIPLIGRLFQSKATVSNKRNLIVFVTANIYRNNGELLNPPALSDATAVLTGRAGIAPVARP